MPDRFALPAAAALALTVLTVVASAQEPAAPSPPVPAPASASQGQSVPAPIVSVPSGTGSTTSMAVRPAPGAPAIVLPVLPVDARKLVDQSTTSLIEQLQGLLDMYLANQRPDDAAAVRAQIKLLRQVTGLEEDAARTSDRVSMISYRDRAGESFQFTITGSADLPVWGTSIYTDDTPIESAAVHAGVLRSGQTGPVRVTILAGQAQYVGTKKNGIESSSYGRAPGSYRIEIGAGTASRPTSIANFRGRIGEVLTIPVVGTASGSVWGSDIYTDDSSLAAAAVHAGLLQPGEFGFVRVTMLGGEAAYAASTRNGVASQAYAEWQGSFRLTAAPQPWVLKVPDDVTDASGMVSLATMRKQAGVSFEMKLVGASGPVRGSDIYTDDTSIAAAAVHSGALRAGEKGMVRITILPGQQNYAGSTQNGIRSTDAGVWGGSFRIDRVPGG